MKDSMKLIKAAGIFCAMLLAACTDDSGPAMDAVVLHLKWKHSAQFAGFYIAQQEGYYAAEGIEVTFQERQLDYTPIEAVVAGQGQFGVWPGDNLLVARSKGQQVTGLAAVFQINPTAYFALAESGIRKPADFKGKRVSYYDADRLFLTVLRSAGLSLDDIEAYPTGFDPTPLLEGEVDVWTGYLTNQVASLRAAGVKLNVILAYDYQGFVYSDVLFTSDAMLSGQPDLVRRFLRATTRGWHEALEYPEKAVDAVLKMNPALEREQVAVSMNASIPLIEVSNGPFGQMDDIVWRTTQDILLRYGELDAELDLTQAYTNKFLSVQD